MSFHRQNKDLCIFKNHSVGVISGLWEDCSLLFFDEDAVTLDHDADRIVGVPRQVAEPQRAPAEVQVHLLVKHDIGQADDHILQGRRVLLGFAQPPLALAEQGLPAVAVADHCGILEQAGTVAVVTVKVRVDDEPHSGDALGLDKVQDLSSLTGKGQSIDDDGTLWNQDNPRCGLRIGVAVKDIDILSDSFALHAPHLLKVSAGENIT